MKKRWFHIPMFNGRLEAFGQEENLELIALRFQTIKDSITSRLKQSAQPWLMSIANTKVRFCDFYPAENF